nr:MAG TPA: hypothetical protein [Caudoviricetes sp.]
MRHIFNQKGKSGMEIINLSDSEIMDIFFKE